MPTIYPEWSEQGQAGLGTHNELDPDTQLQFVQGWLLGKLDEANVLEGEPQVTVEVHDTRRGVAHVFKVAPLRIPSTLSHSQEQLQERLLLTAWHESLGKQPLITLGYVVSGVELTAVFYKEAWAKAIHAMQEALTARGEQASPDWRPNETIAEDFYAAGLSGTKPLGVTHSGKPIPNAIPQLVKVWLEHEGHYIEQADALRAAAKKHVEERCADFSPMDHKKAHSRYRELQTQYGVDAMNARSRGRDFTRPGAAADAAEKLAYAHTNAGEGKALLERKTTQAAEMVRPDWRPEETIAEDFYAAGLSGQATGTQKDLAVGWALSKLRHAGILVGEVQNAEVIETPPRSVSAPNKFVVLQVLENSLAQKYWGAVFTLRQDVRAHLRHPDHPSDTSDALVNREGSLYVIEWPLDDEMLKAAARQMQEAMSRAGEDQAQLDWRPTETVAEDFYAAGLGATSSTQAIRQGVLDLLRHYMDDMGEDLVEVDYDRKAKRYQIHFHANWMGSGIDGENLERKLKLLDEHAEFVYLADDEEGEYAFEGTLSFTKARWDELPSLLLQDHLGPTPIPDWRPTETIAEDYHAAGLPETFDRESVQHAFIRWLEEGVNSLGFKEQVLNQNFEVYDDGKTHYDLEIELSARTKEAALAKKLEKAFGMKGFEVQISDPPEWDSQTTLLFGIYIQLTPEQEQAWAHQVLAAYQAKEIDWRPIEFIPEDFYAAGLGGLTEDICADLTKKFTKALEERGLELYRSVVFCSVKRNKNLNLIFHPKALHELGLDEKTLRARAQSLKQDFPGLVVKVSTGTNSNSRQTFHIQVEVDGNEAVRQNLVGAGEQDWRPGETIPEDFYAAGLGAGPGGNLVPISTLFGKRVEVYRNLNNGLWSIKEGGKVRAYAERLCLEDASFVVQEGARQRVLKEKRKAVHAWVKGTLARSKGDDGEGEGISYNPYAAGHFYPLRDQKLNLTHAAMVCFDVNATPKVTAMGVETVRGQLGCCGHPVEGYDFEEGFEEEGEEQGSFDGVRPLEQLLVNRLGVDVAWRDETNDGQLVYTLDARGLNDDELRQAEMVLLRANEPIEAVEHSKIDWQERFWVVAVQTTLVDALAGRLEKS